VKEKVLLVGAGAMACLFAAGLARAGFSVLMLDRWRTGIAALNNDGVQIVDETGQVQVFPVRAISDPSEVRDAQLALVLVKSWQTRTIAAWLKTCLASDGIAVSVQNGLGNYETLVEALGVERTAAAITTLGATQLGPARVRVHSQGEIVFSQHPRLAPLLEILASANFQVRTTPDISGLLWGKLLINAAVNPLTALLDVPNGRLLELPDARELMNRLVTETESVAAALGIDLPFTAPIRRVEEVLRLTAENSSSMRQDLARGAPTEIDAINGAVVRYGEESGVATPYNRSVWQLVRARAAVVRNQHEKRDL
jgi:2-dehydropantoate 2-reductase